MERFGTIEFRQHSGTVDFSKISNWVRLVVTFVHNHQVVPTELLPHIDKQRFTPKLALQCLFQFVVRNKKLEKYYEERATDLNPRDQDPCPNCDSPCGSIKCGGNAQDVATGARGPMSVLNTLVQYIRDSGGTIEAGGLHTAKKPNYAKFARQFPAAADTIGKLKSFVQKHRKSLKWVDGRRPIIKVVHGDNAVNTTPQTKKQQRAGSIATTVRVFYNAVCSDASLRERCEDRSRFNASFREWKEQRKLQGEILRGGAAVVLYQMKKNKWVESSCSGVLVFKGASPQGTRKSRAADAAERVRTQKAEFESDKHGITITSSDEFFTDVLRIGAKSEQIIVITKSSLKPICLMSVEQVTHRAQFSGPTLEQFRPYSLKPGGTNALTFICSPTSAGMLRTIFVFNFQEGFDDEKSAKRFSIGRYVEARSGNREHIDLLKPATPYKKKVRGPKPTRAEQVIDDPDAKPSISKPPPWVHNLEFYNPSGGWKSMIVHGEASDWLEEELAKLSPSNYTKFFHRLLWCEEAQQEIDIRFFDIEGVLEEDRQYQGCLIFEVPGLAENRPSVLRGDSVKIRRLDMPGKVFVGYAHAIFEEKVALKFSAQFHRNYIKGLKVKVEFQITRTPMRIFHQGAEMTRHMNGGEPGPILFPEPRTKIHPPDGPYSLDYLSRFPAFRTLNQLQQQAVKAIIEGQARPTPYIIFGPPGTGKTRTMVSAAYLFFRLNPKATILLCAPSNSAADLLVERLAEQGVKSDEMIRIMAYSRALDTVTDKVKPFAKSDGEHFIFPALDVLRKYSVVVATVVTAGKLWNNGVEREHFDAIFIDEAGHALEPEAVAPLATLLDGEGRIILAGDPKQLGPIIMSSAAKTFGLECSLLERLLERPIYARLSGSDEKYNSLFFTKLEENYRSHPDILELSNKLFYDGDLKVKADPLISHNLSDWEHLPKKGVPLIFHGVEGRDQREGTSPSWFNVDEVSQVFHYVRCLLEDTKKNKVQQHEIGIISPYNKQVQKIKKLLESKGYHEIKVASTELFQGQERRVMIISTVRSSEEYISFDQKYNLGFLVNSKRFNVAITRAKALLIVIGNPRVLSTDKNWNELIMYCKTKGAYAGSTFEPTGGEGGARVYDGIKRVEEMVNSMEAEADIKGDEDNEPSQRMQQETGAMVRHEE
jgi:helicase MOV-10